MEEKVSTSLPQVESVTVLLPLLPVRFVLLLAPVRPLLSGSPIPLFSGPVPSLFSGSVLFACLCLFVICVII
ncbi:hypothetical protein MtrunA17_Chr2g0311441 [Medicago truncatula]|uniref:Transmembrane protein n=1 Tax=Medicago truncatula TaxID=3880 RepID=A0A396JB64_MEDTR|nr:hypothetical protein MtrunA17_Chr2g0311441 [Medicago truncatula]